MKAVREKQGSWLERPLFPNLKLNWETAIFGLILLLAVISRFYDLGLRVMSHDESLHTYFSWLLSRGGNFEHTPLMHGPLQFHLIALSYFLFGASDFTARIPMALASILTIGFLWNYRRYLGRSGALVAAGLFLISPFMLYYGRYVRNEAFVALFGVVTIWAILRYLDTGGRRYLYFLTAATALHFTSKETSFIFTAQALLFLLGLFLYRLSKGRWRNNTLKTVFVVLILGTSLLTVGGVATIQFGEEISELGSPETAIPVDPGALQNLVESFGGGLSNLGGLILLSASVLSFTALIVMIRGMPKKSPDSNDVQSLILSTVALALLSILIGLIVITEKRLDILQQYLTIQPPPETLAFFERLGSGILAPTFYLPVLTTLLGLGMLAAAYNLTRNVLKILPALRNLRSFDLIMLLGVLVLPHLSAIPINAVGWTMGNYTGLQSIQFVQISMILVPISLMSVGIGYAWKGKDWLKMAAVFYSIFAVFYTTVFTYGAGFFSGMVSSLGYWLVQQGVERGSQPDYYYVLVQVPVYEYLAAIATLLAVGLGIRWWWRSSSLKIEVPEDEAVSIEDEKPVALTHSEGRRLALIFLAFWVVTSFLIFSVAGEKMPWLTVHLALPMLLLGGWAIGRMIDAIDWAKFQEQRGFIALLVLPIFITSLTAGLSSLLGATAPFQGNELHQLRATSTFLFSLIMAGVSGWGLLQLFKSWEASQVVALITIAFFGLLGLMTTKTAFAATFINYDRATEYLVYAHSARPVKDVMEQVEEISRRMTGGLDLEIGYDDDVTWPFSWYLRDYGNARLISDFGPEVRNIPVLIIGNDNWGKIEPLVGRNYYQFEYIRMWWPNQDYFNLFKNSDGNPSFKKIKDFITDPGLRNGLMQIWLDRNYEPYAQAIGNANSLSLENWSPSDRMRLYIRKDIVAQIWDYGVSPIPDPYEDNVLTLIPERVIGVQGIGPVEFNSPRDIAVAPDGSIYVADTYNHRIQHLSASGSLINEWGTFGNDITVDPSVQVTFNEPWGLAVSPDGEFVYVTDTWNHRVQKFTADGDFVTQWGVSEFELGTTEFGFYGPRDVAVDADGNVYITDTGNKRVVVYTEDGEFITFIGGFGLSLGQFDEPVGITIDRNAGLIYVADAWNQRVQVIRINPDGSYLPISAWDVAGWNGQAIENKPYIAVDREGNVYITDPEIARVIVFSSDGDYLYSWTVLGVAQTGGLINGIVVDEDGGVWVSDSRNHVVYYYIIP